MTKIPQKPLDQLTEAIQNYHRAIRDMDGMNKKKKVRISEELHKIESQNSVAIEHP